MEYPDEYYNANKMEELIDKYEGYENMNAESLQNEQSILLKSLVDVDAGEEMDEIKEEIGYIEALQRKLPIKDYYTDSKMKELAERFDGEVVQDAEGLTLELEDLEIELLETTEDTDIIEIREEIGYLKELRRRLIEKESPTASEMEKLSVKYEEDTSMNAEDLLSKQKTLERSGEDGEEEIVYVKELRKRLDKEKYPDLAGLSYDDLMDRGDWVLNSLILDNLDVEEARLKSEELRYIRMLASDYQRKSNLNSLLNTRARTEKRDLVKIDERRRLNRFRKWAKDNAGVLSAVLISSAAVIAGLVATARSMAWKLGDESRIINKKLDGMTKNQIKLPPVFQGIADGLELVGDNIWIILAGAVGAIFLIYELT